MEEGPRICEPYGRHSAGSVSPAAPGGESRPRGVPHPPWVDSVFCQSRGSQGGRRGGHLQRGPFRGQRESGSQERIPGLLGGRGLLRAACPVSASRLGPARSPPQFASFPFCFPSSSSPPSSGNLPPETHHSLLWRQSQCRSPAEARGGTGNHAPYLLFSAKEVQEPRLALPGRVPSLFISSLGDGDHLPLKKPSLQLYIRL